MFIQNNKNTKQNKKIIMTKKIGKHNKTKNKQKLNAIFAKKNHTPPVQQQQQQQQQQQHKKRRRNMSKLSKKAKQKQKK